MRTIIRTAFLGVILSSFHAQAGADKTVFYFEVDDKDGNCFVSQLVTLPFEPSQVTYESAGQEALARAKQNFVNRVKSQFQGNVYLHDVHAARKPEHMSTEQFESNRLDSIGSRSNICRMRQTSS